MRIKIREETFFHHQKSEQEKVIFEKEFFWYIFWRKNLIHNYCMFEEKGEEELSGETQLWKIKEWKLTELQMSKI